MQKLGQTSSLNTVYTDAQVTAILLDQQNQERWLFDQLGAAFDYKFDLTPYVDYERNIPKITHDSSLVVKRKLDFTLRGDAPLKEINFLSDIIRVRYQLRSPDGGWLEWVLGYFTLTPFDQDIYPGWTWHMIKSPDLSQLLVDTTFEASFGVPAGVGYTAAIQSILALYDGLTPIKSLITATDKVLPTAVAWQIGDTLLQAINDLLTAINYYPAWFDENGVLKSSPIPDYSIVSASFVFDTTADNSITMIPIQERPDITKIYNKFIVVVEDARKASFSQTYTNTNPADPISAVNWHKKTLKISDSKIVDAETAFKRARTEAQYSSMTYSKQTMTTFPWALSQNNDIYGLVYETADEGLQSNIYLETGWAHTCQTGKDTSHSLQKIL